ncbi:polyprotein [Gossypium australe]|uniref:Polyprotein n=1 Tax=Gossypium australe TaxID=47621 RepID=A0A5B6VM21_9ROSI|nr:polyprotein [Gossypium australe]
MENESYRQMPVTNIGVQYYLKKNNKKKHLCRSKSGRFSEAEIHYHSTFKEILAVKKGYHFLVEMDMSSFPQMLKFRQKIVLHPQLLRHIKGKDNILADFLSRPKIEIFAFKRTSSSWPKPIMMNRPYSSSSTLPISYPITPYLNPEFPPEVMNLVHRKTFHQKTKEIMFEY